MVEEKEVDWKKVFTAALIGDVADLFLDPIPIVGKVVGDAIDITFTLPQIRKELPEADRDMAFLAALAETIPIVELFPNWAFLAAGSYIRGQVLGKEGLPLPKELLGAKGSASKREGKTILEELGLPALEEFLPSMKKRK